ncbi:alkene reductase [Glycomyces xiaoerkulensis]|uniref:alkene reductase n=1 Tax=Glycomyces xiaoerkulensis TaxID=2038139 RepID=UPI000C25929F|nr:alkene reductase [Glycomyces xiaoerkulensis]
MTADLFEPTVVGDLKVPNRLAMAPMTRNRADRRGRATAMMAAYYRQRATAGLIVSESIPISPMGVGYPYTPGLYEQDQMESWRAVTDAVHESGGRIFAQLQHCGRISHPSMLPGGAAPVAPSPIKPSGNAITYEGMREFVTPRALEADRIGEVVTEFSTAARLAAEAGFDGIEVHGANGYLLDQFLRDRTNRRSDRYGGSVENRMRLLEEVLDAVTRTWPTDRVGLRLSPDNSFNSISDSDPQRHFDHVLRRLSDRHRLAYLHLLEGDMGGGGGPVDYAALRRSYNGVYIANNGYDLDRARRAVRSGHADLVAFGAPFLANPDLVARYREGLPLNRPDSATFYQGGSTGYTDYPVYGTDRQGGTR